jgi:hypothetical protein
MSGNLDITIFLTLLKTTPRALKLPIYEVFIILKDETMTWQKWGSKQALEKRKTSLSLMEILIQNVKILTN